MCQISVVYQQQDKEELIAENVSLLEVENNGVKISTLFEEPKLIEGAAVSRIDFLAGKVILTNKL
ncbi:CooT family nickel-binding protein [Desulfurivibrio alkaliphilus]|uniref:RNA-binding protein, predicted n=1 Tax=Desulfurivibrio alkaliphilus (strain DSM 19089 / UNIQEM U267 / AHT2) TaxID=589865 RepID=D6Z5H3_DESAT|nr:CooT family nickel-binding protein [Desulfurivibrio alkaliphilus]ADH86710.1 RNA-binding protein, predicted [Desulfurivibrio alkaliphilus AHT 2]